MKTACFLEYRGPGAISIARRAPRNSPIGLKVYRELAPGPWFNSVTKAKYIELYQKEVLDLLDPQETWDKLHALAAGAEPVLLCWEKTPLTAHNWCHRTMVAQWFKRELEEVVLEGHPAKVERQMTLR